MSLQDKLDELGWLGFLRCSFSRLKLRALRLVFRFDPWHADAPCACRPYKQIVADSIGQLVPRGVVEIGCGLGDIGHLLRERDVAYIGLDAEAAVIAAGRYLRRGLDLRQGSFEHLGDAGADANVLLLLNWPHGLASSELATLANGVPAGFDYLVVDLIRQDAPALGFTHRHTVTQLRQDGLQASLLTLVERIDPVRDLAILKYERALHPSLR
ncbi:hypothetical protein EIP75_10660 [Aquabacterium soli]|uniref:Methyltransferase domain-containing protein n=1 Tax=Aquabacterium soli TaxID=2493092 RepID=A0A426VBV3_9BURK|nr:hypothetical protein [Aquabacterium soli]RRS04346.1 hypothetical protein EIP75_10660 [Aquabacterium soli]